MNATSLETPIFIGGEPRPASSGASYELYNPARPTELVGRAAMAGKEDVDAAVKAAHAAYPAWSALSFGERAEMMRNVAKAIAADEEDVARRSEIFTREHGKIRRETMMELSRLGDRFMQVAAYAERLATDEQLRPSPMGSPFDTIITRQARGVAALIVPSNWPLSILGAKLPQALLAGNTVVVKPAQNSAMAPSLTLQIIAELLPAGVVNIITGSARDIGDELVGHPLVSTVNFTGSVGVGQHVMRVASHRLTPVTLELGGNDAALVLEDAELNPETFMKMYMGTFASTGQICMAMKRLYVHESRYDDVVQGMLAACEQAVVGDGLLPETTMGPVNNAGQLKVVTDMIAEARSKGADVIESGTVPDEALYQGGGYFQRPTLVLDADQDLSVVREEQFGPVLPIMKFKTDDEAIALANDNEFDLCSSVWIPDAERAVALARRLEAGGTYLNNHGPMSQDGRAPFGGLKMSGIGRNLGFEGVLGFMEPHTITGPGGFLFDD
jgi:acyl-CoA reductase-like NAD-dependent aldehyde dehydrogenase